MNTLVKAGEEFLIGGSAASFACLFTNPLEVVKTRLQLQGELQSRGSYQKHYKNFFHAFYTIGKMDGILALQSGLVSGLFYQMVMNGTRLGSYQILANLKLHHDGNTGAVSYPRALLMGASCGAFGAFVGSPLYMIKTHLQVQSGTSIAVGYQRSRRGLVTSLANVWREYGLSGLWRGWQAQVLRVMFGSGVQLSTFSKLKSILHEYEICDRSTLYNSFLASCVGAVAVTVVMAPFDVLSTRIYNQPLDAKGKGLYYAGVADALVKVLKREGVWGFYKGASAVFMRLSPHTIITLIVWDRLRQQYNRLLRRDGSGFSTA